MFNFYMFEFQNRAKIVSTLSTADETRCKTRRPGAMPTRESAAFPVATKKISIICHADRADGNAIYKC